MSSGGFPCWNFLTAGICVSTSGISLRVRFYRHQAAGRKLLLLRSRFALTQAARLTITYTRYSSLTWQLARPFRRRIEETVNSLSTTAQVYAQG